MWLLLWFCIGTLYMFAFSNRAYLQGHRDLPGFITEFLWSHILVSPSCVGIIYALKEIFS